MTVLKINDMCRNTLSSRFQNALLILLFAFSSFNSYSQSGKITCLAGEVVNADQEWLTTPLANFIKEVEAERDELVTDVDNKINVWNSLSDEGRKKITQKTHTQFGKIGKDIKREISKFSFIKAQILHPCNRGNDLNKLLDSKSILENESTLKQNVKNKIYEISGMNKIKADLVPLINQFNSVYKNRLFVEYSEKNTHAPVPSLEVFMKDLIFNMDVFKNSINLSKTCPIVAKSGTFKRVAPGTISVSFSFGYHANISSAGLGIYTDPKLHIELLQLIAVNLLEAKQSFESRYKKALNITISDFEALGNSDKASTTNNLTYEGGFDDLTFHHFGKGIEVGKPITDGQLAFLRGYSIIYLLNNYPGFPKIDRTACKIDVKTTPSEGVQVRCVSFSFKYHIAIGDAL